MTITTRIMSVSVEVADQDKALTFYRDVLGCEVRTDIEVWPGARLVEVVPPGSDVAIALLTRESGLPIGVRYVTEDAEEAHRALTAAGVTPHQPVLYTDFAPPMFTLDDPDGNTIILIEPGGENRDS
ncbi:MAG TPA: VOC family protein [Actinomycetales bacterium]|nr:VOC family protein [Actinomycetales bacterium]